MKITILKFLSSATLVAQSISASGSEIYAVMGALVLILTLVSLGYQILSHRRNLLDTEPRRRILPDPLRISALQDPIPRSEFERHEEKVSANFKSVFEEIRNEGRRVDSRINDVLEEVSKMRGEFDQCRRNFRRGDE